MQLTGSGQNAQSRDIPFWITAGGSALLTCAVLVALVILHAWSVQQESGAQTMSTLRTAIAVEQEGVLDSVSTRLALQADANAALRAVASTDASDSALPSITRMADDYQAAVSIELAGIRAGGPQSAADLNAQVGEIFIHAAQRGTGSRVTRRSRRRCSRCDHRVRGIDGHGPRIGSPCAGFRVVRTEAARSDSRR